MGLTVCGGEGQYNVPLFVFPSSISLQCIFLLFLFSVVRNVTKTSHTYCDMLYNVKKYHATNEHFSYAHTRTYTRNTVYADILYRDMLYMILPQLLARTFFHPIISPLNRIILIHPTQSRLLPPVSITFDYMLVCKGHAVIPIHPVLNECGHFGLLIVQSVNILQCSDCSGVSDQRKEGALLCILIGLNVVIPKCVYFASWKNCHYANVKLV